MVVTLDFKSNITSRDDSSLYPTNEEEYNAIEPLVELVNVMKNLGD